ncbi:MAG: hypothetical protein ACRC0F_04130 [Cetobacterium sp.]
MYELKKEIFEMFKKYGIVGVILAYFLVQDYQDRELERQQRKNDIEFIKTLVNKVEDINTRTKVLEYESSIEKIEINNLQKDINNIK